MFLETLLVQLNATNNENRNLLINESNAYSVGLNIDELKNRFYQETGRTILTNESIKVLFDKEGGHLDFSTFDGVSIRVNFNEQSVAPNKGGDGFER